VPPSVRRIVPLLALLALGACQPAKLMTDGPSAAAPSGWSDYCIRHPEVERCKT
jgi:predicted transglutaminase-like cysteine proteinase